MLTKGDRVLTPYGEGTIAYVRMAPPTFSEVWAVSVVLDNKKDIFGYSGTMVPAEKVKKLEE